LLRRDTRLDAILLTLFMAASIKVRSFAAICC
jgi:hypothetical protein